jgi:hypothetical protein
VHLYARETLEGIHLDVAYAGEYDVHSLQRQPRRDEAPQSEDRRVIAVLRLLQNLGITGRVGEVGLLLVLGERTVGPLERVMHGAPRSAGSRPLPAVGCSVQVEDPRAPQRLSHRL